MAFQVDEHCRAVNLEAINQLRNCRTRLIGGDQLADDLRRQPVLSLQDPRRGTPFRSLTIERLFATLRAVGSVRSWFSSFLTCGDEFESRTLRTTNQLPLLLLTSFEVVLLPQ